MAALQCFILSSFKILFCSSILLMLFSSSANEIRASQTEFLHTLDITSQLSATECSSAIPRGLKNRQSSAVMEVTHRHSPCADKSSERTPILSRPSAADILRSDQLRVESINNRGGASRSPLISGYSLGTRSYIVTMGLGTPEKKQNLILDTGSDVTWAQCKPCYLGCYSQAGPLFDPRMYSVIPSNSSDCSLAADDVDSPTGFSFNKYCIYSDTYNDGSMTIGYFSKDTLTIAPNVAVPGFMFGCSQYARGLFGRASGLLGLSRGNMSLVSQTANKFKECFSYCLPSKISTKGYLVLGKDYDNATQFTPLIFKPEYPLFYFIDIISIAVEGSNLPIRPNAFTRSGGAVIDSGTVITRLPPDVYKSLSIKIKEMMTKKYNYTAAPSYSIMDTCFFRNKKDVAASMSFTFKKNVQVDLDASKTFIALNDSMMCLAFAGNTDPTEFTIFGNWQQKTFEVVYDVAGSKIGFRRGMYC